MSTRKCEIVTNLYDAENNPLIDLELMKKILVGSNCISEYSYIIHDKDIYTLEEEGRNPQHKAGTLKPKHIHLLLKFRCPQQYEYIAKWFKLPSNFVSKIKGRWEDAVMYQLHLNAPEKHQYSVEEVISNFDVLASIEKVRKKVGLDKILNRIMSGDIREYNKTTEIDPLILVKHIKQIDAAFRMYSEHMQATKHERKMECIFITGTSGSGKTTLAKKICNEKKLAFFVSSGTNDIMDGYMQQPAIILDDIRPSALGFSDLLKLLDNNTASTVKSRYKNKSIYADLIILTTVMDMETFYKNIFEQSDEPIIQLKRRCGTHIRMNKDKIFISQWDSHKMDYTEEIEYNNTILKDYIAKEEKSIEELENNINKLMPFLQKTEEKDLGWTKLSTKEQLELPFEKEEEHNND